MTAKKRSTKAPAKKRKSSRSQAAAKTRATKAPAKRRPAEASAKKRTTKTSVKVRPAQKLPKKRASKTPARTRIAEAPAHNRASKASAAKRAAKAPSEKRTSAALPKGRLAKAPAKTRTRRRSVQVNRAQAPTPEKAALARPAFHTRICDHFGIEYPIVQTGMGWVSGVSLTSATSRAGGLGILAGATMTLRDLTEAIRTLKDQTDKPFGVNLRADQSDIMQRVDLLIDERVKVASFAQAPGEPVIKALKDAGVLTMPTIGARRDAEKAQAWGVDAVIAQGQEGSGHTGEIPTSVLIPDVSAAVDIPVVAAGGFRDGRGLVAALALGAEGMAMGTRFLLTQESKVPDHVKDVYLQTKANETVVTKAIDGHPQRVIRTPLVEQLEKASPLTRFPMAALNALSLMRVTGTSLPELIEEGLAMRQRKQLSWSQLAIAANAAMLTKASMVEGRIEAGILPTGQVAGVIDDIPTVAQLLERIMGEAQDILERLNP